MDLQDFTTFLSDAYWASEQSGTLGCLLLVRVLQSGSPLTPEDMQRASYLVAQLARQADAVALVDDETVGIALRRVQRRGDAHLMMERISDFFQGSTMSWELTMGVSVFPLCGSRPEDAWTAARRDLDGALSHDTWEHEIPRDTLRMRSAGNGNLY